MNEAAALLARARRAAGMSQTELARRADVAQSVISAYENGQREPSIPTLLKLVAATGYDVRFDLDRRDDAKPGIPDTPLGRRLRRRRAAVLAVAERYGATNVRVFGSVARGEDDEDSDIDLVAELAPGTGLFELAGLQREIGEVLGARVDVVPDDALKPLIRAAVERDGIPL